MTRPATTLAQLANDIGVSASLIGAPHSADTTRRVLEAFAGEFTSSAVEFRTTNKPERELSYRYVNIEQADANPYAICRKTGLLATSIRPVDRLADEVQTSFELAGWGVDAGAQYGVEKLWPFLKYGYPIDRALSMSHLPPAVKDHGDYLRRHALNHFSILAIDYRHETANLYFVFPPGTHAPTGIAGMIRDAGFEVPTNDVLEYNAGSVAAALTFSYSSKQIERLCFYVPAPDASLIPASQREAFSPVVNQMPCVAAQRLYIVGHTFARRPYVKLELDYTGTTLACLQKCMMVPLAA
jgi:4-hydroxyphenylpyruvate 3-dimethylallyltransferase